jgi:AcrR family transcriptional regulator
MARGRPRKFDEQEVLGKAAQLFRERGYERTSMQALSEAMDMGEQSIYNAFGSKQQVFERALDQYCNNTAASLQALADPDASLGAIEAFLTTVVNTMSREPACLVTQTCLSSEDGDGPVARRASRHMRNMERYLLQPVENAIEKGELAADDPKKIARFLNMTIQGLSVMAHSGTSKKALRDLVDVSLQALR